MCTAGTEQLIEQKHQAQADLDVARQALRRAVESSCPNSDEVTCLQVEVESLHERYLCFQRASRNAVRRDRALHMDQRTREVESETNSGRRAKLLYEFVREETGLIAGKVVGGVSSYRRLPETAAEPTVYLTTAGHHKRVQG